MIPIGRLLMGAGALLFLLGLLITFGGRVLPLGRLPGDFSFHRGNVSFFFPLGTSLLLSIVLTLVLWLIGRGR